MLNFLTEKSDLGAKQMHVPRVWTGPVVQPGQRKGDMRFGIWNVRKLYRSGSHTKAARELARYKLDLGGCRRLGG